MQISSNLTAQELQQLKIFRLKLEYGNHIPKDLVTKPLEETFQPFDMAIAEVLLNRQSNAKCAVLTLRSLPHIKEIYTWDSSGKLDCQSDFIKPSRVTVLKRWLEKSCKLAVFIK